VKDTRTLTLIEVEARRCSLCGAPYGRPNPGCMPCRLRRDRLPAAPPDPAADALATTLAAREQARLDGLRVLGRPVRVGLVGCSASKREGIHKARDLYLGAFFRHALPIALGSCDEVWILSARHGLLHLEHATASYDEQLPTRQRDRGFWGNGVLSSLHNAYPHLPVHLVFYAGAPYVEGITGLDPRTGRSANLNWIALGRAGWTYETPLRGLDRPARFAWFNTHSGVPSPQNGDEGARDRLGEPTPSARTSP
jgi:hypothetical protein